MPPVTRVVIAEDHLLLRDGLVRLLSANGLEVAASVDNAAGLLDIVAEQEPDIAVIDVRLPPTFTDEGLRAAIELRGRKPGFPVLILSQYVEQLYARELLSDGKGGVGYLLKDRVGDIRQFVDAVGRVASGGTAMDPEVISEILGSRTLRRPLAELTRREREVLALIAEGRTNAAIAQRLVITSKAVSKHIARIFTKLDLLPSDEDHRRVLAVLAYLNSHD
jgi:DNA-binding NarL/FixJ family response regulator